MQSIGVSYPRTIVSRLCPRYQSWMIRFCSFFLPPVALLLASCAQHPRLEVGQSGEFPVPAGFRLDYDEAALPPELVTGITGALQAHEFRPTEQPRYLVQLTSADRPANTGLFLPDAPPDESGNHSWLSSPARSKSARTRRMAVSVIDVANGQEVYRIQASELYRPRHSDDGQGLASAILAQLPPQ